MAVVGALRAILSVNSTAFRGGMKGASNSLLAYSGANRIATVSTRITGAAMTGLVGAASAASAAIMRLVGSLTAVAAPFIGIYGAIKALRFSEVFSQEMYASLSIIDDVGAKMRARMEQVTFDIAYVTKFGMAEAAKGYYYLAQAGYDVAQSLKALPQVAYFAQAGMFDLARATDLATDAQTALGLSVDDPEQNLTNLIRVTSVLVKASKLANSSVELYSKALTTDAANAARIAGQSIEEVVSVLAAFAQKGEKGEKAGTAYARALNYLSIQAIQNADAYERAGVAVFDAAGKSRSLVDVLADLDDRFGSLTDRERYAELGVLGFTKKTIALMNTLLGGETRIRVFQEKLTGIGNVAKKVSDGMLPPLTAAWEKLKAVIGRFLTMKVTPILDVFGGAVGLVVDYVQETGKAADAMEDVAEAAKSATSPAEYLAMAFMRVADTIVVIGRMTKSVVAQIREMAEELRPFMSAGLQRLFIDPLSWTIGSELGKDLPSDRFREWLKERKEKEAAGGGKVPGTEAAAMTPPPTLTTQAGASGILRGQDATTVTLESMEGKLNTFQKEWLTEESKKKLADGVAKAATEGFAKATSVRGGAAFAGPLEAQMSRAKSIFNSTRTPLEKFNDQMEELRSLLDVGAFAGMGGEETYRRAVEKARDTYEKAGGAGKTAQPPTLARMGSQEAYDLVRQNRMGDGPQVAPMVKEQQRTNQGIEQMNASLDEMVDEMREHTEALQGETLDL